MIESTKIIKRIVISEKAAKSSESASQYVFEVAETSNKVSIRQAVEASFKGVKVAWVNVVKTPSKTKRILTRQGGTGIRQGYKKAIVCLKEGKIELN